MASIASFYIEFYKVWIRTENLINFIGMEVVKRNEVVYYLCFSEEEKKKREEVFLGKLSGTLLIQNAINP